jgi:hypothetical protein
MPEMAGGRRTSAAMTDMYDSLTLANERVSGAKTFGCLAVFGGVRLL